MHHGAGTPFGSLPNAEHPQSGSQLYLLRGNLAAVEGGGSLIEVGVGVKQVVVINCNQHWNLQHTHGFQKAAVQRGAVRLSRQGPDMFAPQHTLQQVWRLCLRMQNYANKPHLVHLGHLLHQAHRHLGLIAVLPSLRRVGKLQQSLLS